MSAAPLCLGVDLLAAFFWIFAAVQLVKMKFEFDRVSSGLDSEASLDAGPWPKISVVVAARDEGAAIETALRSLLSQDYPDFEIVAVDDRSADETGRIMDRLAAEDSRLKVVHVEKLPPGWLGKNNANQQGARQAGGKWILFTDGDAAFAPDAFRRAMAAVRRYGLGHLVVLPRFITKGFWERAFISEFAVFMNIKFRFWDLHRPRTKAYIGSGTFNLVRRESYDAIGGHERLRMEVVDDVKLGLLLRRGGVRQGIVLLPGAVSVRWQDGFLATMRGLLKNAFAGMEWRWSVVAGASLAILLISIAPILILLFAPSPYARLFAILPIFLPIAIQGMTARRACSGSGLEGMTHPISALLLIGVIVWSAISATWRRGITWRGMFYPLDELRAGCVREADYPVVSVVGWSDRG